MAIGKQSKSWGGKREQRQKVDSERIQAKVERKGGGEEIERMMGREIDKESEKGGRGGWAMVIGKAVGATYYREIKGSNSSRDFY